MPSENNSRTAIFAKTRHPFLMAIAALASTLFLQSCASTSRNDLNKEIEGIKPGYSYLQEISGPGVTRELKWVFSGIEDNLNRWDLYFGNLADSKPWKTVWLNESGATVRYEKGSKTVSWEPHDCFRVVGECEFKYIDIYGYENSFLRTGTFNGDSWIYDLYRINDDERALITNGKAKFNKFGIEVFHEYFTSNNGYQISRVKQFY